MKSLASLALSFSICGKKKHGPTKLYIISSLLWEPIIWVEIENDHKKFKAYFPNIYSEKCKTNSEKDFKGGCFQKILFTYFVFGSTESSWLLRGLSLVAASGGFSLTVVQGPLIAVASLAGSHRL